MAGYLGAGLLAAAKARSAYNQGKSQAAETEAQQRAMMLKMALEEAARRRAAAVADRQYNAQRSDADRTFNLQKERFDFEKSKPLPTSANRIDPLSEQGIQAAVQRERLLSRIPTYGQAHPKESQAPEKAQKAPTESQAKANSFLKIMEAEEPNIAAMSNSLPDKYTAKIPVIGNMITAKSNPQYQAQLAAAERWVTQYLRFQSGATISEAEFENAKKQFIPQPGDTPETLRMKAEARQRATQGIREATQGGANSAGATPDLKPNDAPVSGFAAESARLNRQYEAAVARGVDPVKAQEVLDRELGKLRLKYPRR